MYVCIIIAKREVGEEGLGTRLHDILTIEGGGK